MTALIPRYFYTSGHYCLGDDGDLYLSENLLFKAEMQLLNIRYLALSFLRHFKAIHEFGCGPGLNLMVLAEANPDQKVIGYDWTSSGVEMADLIGKKSGMAVSGRRFDMLCPDPAVTVAGEAVLTVNAIEQLGENYQPFLDFLLAQKPALVVNIEPGHDYGDDSVYLRLASLHMNLRGYPRGFAQTLRGLEAEKRIGLVFSSRLPWMGAFTNIACTIRKPL